MADAGRKERPRAAEVSPARASLSVVVPAYNEEPVIAHCVRRLNDVLGGAFEAFEIIVVDDGSTDGTAQVLAELTRSVPRLVVLHNNENRGLGSAVRKGLDQATGEIVLYTDADLPFDFDTIPLLVRRLARGRLDLLVGKRPSRAAEPLMRQAYAAVYNALIGAVFGVRVGDVNFACKLLRRELVDALQLQSSGSFFDAELIVKAMSRGYRVAECDVEALARPAGSSTAARWPVIAKILIEMVWLLPSMRRGRRRDGRPASSEGD